MSMRVAALAIAFLTANSVTTAQFTTVINVPPDQAPGSIGSGTQLNLMDGGVLMGVPLNPENPNYRVFRVGSPEGTSENVELNVFGGDTTRADELETFAGAVTNVSGGLLDNLRVFEGGVLYISGGGGKDVVSVDRGELEFSGGEFRSIWLQSGRANIHGGTLTGEVFLSGDAEATITGGTVLGSSDIDVSLLAGDNSKVTISGGTFGSIGFGGDSNVTISGGTFDMIFSLVGNSEVTISGGTINGGLLVPYADNMVELIGSEFLLDGEAIPGLTSVGDSVILEERGGALLTGMFIEGTPFDFVLNSESAADEDWFHSDATLRVTLVPEPITYTLALVALGLATWSRRH